MAKTYKVWIEVEEKDEENDEYQTLEHLEVQEFDDQERAFELANTLHGFGITWKGN